MKNLLIVLGIFISTFSFSQVEKSTYSARYVTFYEYNTYSNEFEETNSGWLESLMLCERDYYIYKVEGKEASDRIYWEYEEENEYGGDVYFTKDNRKIIFDYDAQTITFFSDYNSYEKVYVNCMVLSKISKE
mgnify:CR=1 FL=1